jgi:hypothetical protein
MPAVVQAFCLADFSPINKKNQFALKWLIACFRNAIQYSERPAHSEAGFHFRIPEGRPAPRHHKPHD